MSPSADSPAYWPYQFDLRDRWLQSKSLTYPEYLAGIWWHTRRIRVLFRAVGLAYETAAAAGRFGGRPANPQCEGLKCAADMEVVHHLHYESMGAEKLADLQALCRPCHDVIHGRST
jgi:hypothetical protein